MDRKIVTKILATMLVFTLTFANIALLGIYAQETYAASVELEEQDLTVDKAEIEFNAYFQEEGMQTHSKDIDVTSNEESLYLSIKVSEGYLKDAQIRLEDANFNLVDSQGELESIQDINTETNTIILNQISKGESVILEMPITMNTDSDFVVENFNKISKVILEGTYVNNDGDDVAIEKTIEVSAKMVAQADATLTSEISKYVQFDINGEKGVVLQETIKSNIINNILPIKQTKIEIEIPKINGIEPTTVVLSSTSTQATNGEDGKTYTQEDYRYENGKITLTIDNEEKENGTISWLKDVQDEIILTCVYEEQAITALTNVETKINSSITPYNDETIMINKTINETVALTEQIGEIMTYNISTQEVSLQKGYMLVEGADNTEYVDLWTANIGCRELVDSVVLENKTSYIDENQNEYPSKQIYTYTKITLENLVGILGENGYINIYGESGNLITTLNKDNLEYTYQEETNYIRIETSKPVSEGMLKIENGRGIKALEYSKAQEELFVGMKTEIVGSVIQNEKAILEGREQAQISFVEPVSQAELTLNRNNISTVVTNEGIELRVTLKTSDSSTALYKNPIIEITFPSYVTSISAENVRLVYEEELKISNATMYINENGNRVIRLELAGEQTKFNKEAQTQGATLIIKADITVDELTPTRAENIIMNISNEQTGEIISTQTPINFIAPVGMVTINQISNYNSEGEKATSISGKTEVGEIETGAESRNATVDMTVINNYRYNCENVTILGRTPFEGNKTVTTGQDLGSTFTARIATTIQAMQGVNSNQMTVYYSSNGEATIDLSNSQNGWTLDPNSVSEVKSFMIVLNDYTLNTGDTITFSYNIEIPEGLSHDESTYGTFAVYYNRQEEKETEDIAKIVENGNSIEISTDVKTYAADLDTVTESTEAPVVGISTGAGPNFSVELTADAENNTEIVENGMIKYTAKITNKSNRKTGVVNLIVETPDNATFISDSGEYMSGTVSIEVGEISANESIEATFTLLAGSYMDVNNIEEEETTYYDENGNEISEEEALDYNEEVYTLSDFNNNEEAYNQYIYALAGFRNELTRDKFESDEVYNMYLEAREEQEARKESLKLDNSINEIRLKVIAQESGYEDTFESNERVNKIIALSEGNSSLQLYASTASEGEKGIGENSSYSLEVTPNSDETLNNVIIRCVLPEGLTFSSATEEGTYDESTKTVTWNFETLEEPVYITMYCKTIDLPEGMYETDAEIYFTGTYSGNNNTFTSNKLMTRIYKNEYTISQESSISEGRISSGTEITYIITAQNLSTREASFTIIDYLPEDLTFVEYYYTQNGTTTRIENNRGNNVNISLELDEGETITVYLTAIADEIGASSREITNRVVLTSTELEDIEANIITHTLVGNRYVPGENEEQNGNEGNTNNTENDITYTISGNVWIDANRNGQRDTTEELLEGITVYLLESNTNNVIATTITASNGTYTFTEIESGRYIVAFEYNTLAYDVTTYQAEGISASVNSDTINMELVINGNTKIYASTNTLIISSNTYNIDLGLVTREEFDLELTKGISLMQVSNSKGTETYNFDNEDLAKVEIPGKYMNGSVVAITYTFKIKNTGSVAGYANRIVDYMPKDLSFSSTLNPEWYLDTDGNLYNTSLKDRLINPGEEVEITLILTKTMTDENVGVVSNSAEIYEASNDLGISDKDSTPGNKSTREDDYGIADAIIAVKTGGVVVYTGIALGVLAIFAIGAYVIKKKVLIKI